MYYIRSCLFFQEKRTDPCLFIDPKQHRAKMGLINSAPKPRTKAIEFVLNEGESASISSPRFSEYLMKAIVNPSPCLGCGVIQSQTNITSRCNKLFSYPGQKG